MKRHWVTLATALAVALAMAVPAVAAELHEPHQGTVCGEGDGLVQLHFVQNQIPDGSGVGWIYVEFADGTTVSQAADKVNKSNQHWTIEVDHESELVNAWTSIGEGGPDLEGMLVLSDYDCKKTEPPKDPDPKKG